MKTKEGFMLRRLGEQYVVVALGKAAEDFRGIIRLNQSGAFLWERLTEGSTLEELAKALEERYGVSEESAAEDAAEFLATLRGVGLLEDDNGTSGI